MTSEASANFSYKKGTYKGELSMRVKVRHMMKLKLLDVIDELKLSWRVLR